MTYLVGVARARSGIYGNPEFSCCKKRLPGLNIHPTHALADWDRGVQEMKMNDNRLSFGASTEAAAVAAIERSTDCAAIRRRELTARKAGRRAGILAADLEVPPIEMSLPSRAPADARPARDK
jgi:hypothetical protein